MAEKEGVDIRPLLDHLRCHRRGEGCHGGYVVARNQRRDSGYGRGSRDLPHHQGGHGSRCIVKEGKIKRSSKIRLIRDGIVIYSGDLGSLKRFKDDVKEVTTALSVVLNIANYNDVKVGEPRRSLRRGRSEENPVSRQAQGK